VWITTERDVGEVLECFLPSPCGDRLVTNVTSEHLSHFDVHEIKEIRQDLISLVLSELH